MLDNIYKELYNIKYKEIKMKDKELKDLERKLLLRYFEDGVVDIYIGYVVAIFGLSILFDMAYLVGAFVAVGIFIPKILKSRYTYPRRGYIKIREAQRSGFAAVLLGVFMAGTFIFLLFGMGTSNPMVAFLRANMVYVIAVIWGGALSVVAAWRGIKRFYGYAAALAFAIIASQWIGSMGLNLLGSGVLIMASGLIMLWMFTRKYPILREGID